MLVHISIYIFSLVTFFLLLAIEYFAKTRHNRILHDKISVKQEAAFINYKLLAGILITGIVNVYWLLTTGNGHLLGFPVNKGVWIIVLVSIAALFTGYASAKKIFPSQFTSEYVPSTFFIVTYVLFRTLFLIGYEFFFRGVVLFSMLIDAGEKAAIALNVLLYMLLHSFSNRKELIGTIPFGILLCAVTLFYQSVWPAIIIHVCLALSHETRILISYKSPLKMSAV